MLKLVRTAPLPLLLALVACETPSDRSFSDDAGDKLRDASVDMDGASEDAGKDRKDASMMDVDAGVDSGFDAGPQFGLDTRIENLTCTATTLGDNPPTL